MSSDRRRRAAALVLGVGTVLLSLAPTATAAPSGGRAGDAVTAVGFPDERNQREERADAGVAAGKSPSGGAGGWLSSAVAVAGLAVPALGALFLVRGRRATGPVSGFTHPRAVFAAARAADEDGLRRRAEAEVVALGEAAQAADADATPGLRRALDAYAAAGTVLDAARGLPDLAGALALAAEGRDALTDSPAALPLCFFNPLHGRADRRTRWRPLGRRDHLDVATCPRCTTALGTRRAPEVLTDTTADGRPVPYFELPRDRSVWAATGYGSLLGGEGDTLTARVERGDFSRSLSAPG
ncbi:hypothetical protein ACFOZ0_27235 [Streptomyces yaanensis]|uniref:Uncharacterized protein n=1 Tax=Streptomyces yaanensis TaxID=1142239 RepID=A0ABV7SJ32_9ACTN